MAGGPRRSFAYSPAVDTADHSVVGGGERELEVGGRPPATHPPAAKASVDSSVDGGAGWSFTWGASPHGRTPPSRTLCLERLFGERRRSWYSGAYPRLPASPPPT